MLIWLIFCTNKSMLFPTFNRRKWVTVKSLPLILPMIQQLKFPNLLITHKIISTPNKSSLLKVRSYSTIKVRFTSHQLSIIIWRKKTWISTTIRIKKMPMDWDSLYYSWVLENQFRIFMDRLKLIKPNWINTFRNLNKIMDIILSCVLLWN